MAGILQVLVCRAGCIAQAVHCHMGTCHHKQRHAPHQPSAETGLSRLLHQASLAVSRAVCSLCAA